MHGNRQTLQMVFKRCCLLLLACLIGPMNAAAAPRSTPIELRVGYQPIASPTGATFEVIKRDRLLRQGLERHNIRLTLVPFKKGSDSITSFRRGELDAIAMGDLPMIQFALTTPVVIIGQLRQGFSAVVALRGTTPQDLKGKRIGNAFASSGHYALMKTLQNGGVAEGDVTLVPLNVNEMPVALLKGRIDAFSVWEPTPSLFIAQYPDRFSSVGRQIGSGYLSVSRTCANQSPQSITLLAAGVARAMRWLAESDANRQRAARWNQLAVQQLSGTAPAASLEDLSRQIGSDLQMIQYSAKLPPLKGQGKDLLADEFMFLKTLGKIPQTAQWETIRTSFDHSIMERIYKNPKASLLNRFDYEGK
jgi:NitT/TauT family transport system substrate-binding protein